MSQTSTDFAERDFTDGRDAGREGTLRRLALLLSAAIAFGVLPYAWTRVYSYTRIVNALHWRDTFITLAAVAAVVVLMRYSRVQLSTRAKRLVAAVGFVAWCAFNGLLWWLRLSSLTWDAAQLMFVAATSLWLFWAWAAPLVTSRPAVRWGVLALLVAMVPLHVWMVRCQGFDGHALVMLSWRRANATPLARPLGGAAGDAAGTARFGEFRGSERRDGKIAGVRLAADWDTEPPRELWRIPLGAGWGSFAVANGQAITQEQRGEKETTVCYDLATGRELWTHATDAAFRSHTAGDGPRATPTIAGDRVVTLGATGRLHCLNRTTGELIWTVDLLTDNKSKGIVHGLSGSPLVVDRRVIASAGGTDCRSLAAYRLSDGDPVWRAGSDEMGYASPQLSDVAGEEQVLIMNSPGLAAHDPKSGRILWTFAWTNAEGVNCSQPLVVPGAPGRVLLTSGYSQGCTLLEIGLREDGDYQVEQLWATRNLKTKFTSAVVHGNFAYGLDDGILTCVDLADGSRRWKRGRYGHGQMLLVGDLLLVQAESGEVVLVAADPDEHRELARLAALHGKTWNHPALAGRLLLVRNDHEAACFELPVEE